MNTGKQEIRRPSWRCCYSNHCLQAPYFIEAETHLDVGLDSTTHLQAFAGWLWWCFWKGCENCPAQENGRAYFAFLRGSHSRFVLCCSSAVLMICLSLWVMYFFFFPRVKIFQFEQNGDSREEEHRVLTHPSSGQAFYLTLHLPVTETLTAQFQRSGYPIQMGPAEGEGQRRAG